VVDDDKVILKYLQRSLVEEDWDILTARNGAQAMHIASEKKPDLIILDIRMPVIDGMEVCRRIREWSHVPIIILSACLDTADKVKSLSYGADDYITKPFEIDELTARIKALLRRKSDNNSVPLDSNVTTPDFEIDFNERRIVVNDGQIKLSPKEFLLLRELVLAEGRVLSYEYLLKTVWGKEYDSEKEYLHVYIKNLRTKIEPNPKSPSYIITVPGSGYLFKNMHKDD